MTERLSLPSPLQRRINRHTNLATLFRQPAAAPVTSLGSGQPSSRLFASEPGGSSEAEPVKARLLPPESRLPQAILLPRLPVVSQRSTSREEPQAPAAPDPASLQTAAQPASPLPPAPAAPTAALPAAPPQATLQETDPNWRRLQTIYRRHQERLQAGQTSGESSAQVQASPSDQPPAAAGRQPESLPPTGPGPAIEKSGPKITSLAGQPAASTGAPIQPQPAGQPSPPAAEAPPARTPSPGRSPDAGPEASPQEAQASEPAQKPPLEAVWPVQRTSPEAAPARSAAPPGPEQLESSPSAAQPTPSPTPATARLVEPEPSAWALEHLTRAKTGQPSASSVEVIPPRRPPPIRPQAMRQAETSRAAPLTAAETTPEHQPWAGHEPEPTSEAGLQPDLQPGLQAGHPPGATANDQIRTQSEPSKPPAATTGSGQSQPAGPRQIQTEIGPLPEDLWRLLGEEPPPLEGDTAPYPARDAVETLVTSPAPIQGSDTTPTLVPDSSPPMQASLQTDLAGETSPASAVQPPPARAQSVPADEAPQTPPAQPPQPANQTAAIQRAIAAAESKPNGPEPLSGGSPAAFPVKDVLPPIQQQAAPEAAPQANTSALRQESASQPAESELDLDDLARQVYNQLRRRLEIDTERLRRRG